MEHQPCFDSAPIDLHGGLLYKAAMEECVGLCPHLSWILNGLQCVPGALLLDL